MCNNPKSNKKTKFEGNSNIMCSKICGGYASMYTGAVAVFFLDIIP